MPPKKLPKKNVDIVEDNRDKTPKNAMFRITTEFRVRSSFLFTLQNMTYCSTGLIETEKIINNC